VNVLSPARLRTVEAIARVALPPGGPQDGPAQAAREVDGWVLYMPRMLRAALPLGLWLFEWAALLVAGSRFSRLTPGPALAYLRRFMDLPLIALREMSRSLVKLCLFSHYADPRNARAIGYEPDPWMQKKVAERRALVGPEEDAP
jgi:hypothetical protein